MRCAWLLVLSVGTSLHAANLTLCPEREASPAGLEPAATNEPFKAGSWNLNLYAGQWREAFGGDNEKLTFGTVDVEYFLRDDLSLNGEFVGYSVDQREPDAAAFGFNLIGRYYFWKPVDAFAIYFEGGAGIFEGDHRVPTPDGTHHNFTLHVGFGARYQLAQNLALIGGFRYFHLSNASIEGKARNPSIDGFGGYGGFSIDF